MKPPRPDSAYQLPDPINAPPLCVIVPVPNSRFHIQAFQSQILELSFWWAWKRDSAHTARLAAQVWKDIYYKLQFINCNEICPPAPGIEVEDEVSLHIDCNCEVRVDCCDGTQKQLVTVDMLNPTALQKSGANQPAPGGGSAEYCLRVFGNGMQLVPTPVSTGDVISIASATGATNDPSGPSPDFWYCESGELYFGGECGGRFDLVGTDPLPATKHLALIVNIAGTFYDLSAGPVTVPAGVSSIQPTLQVNDSTLSDNNGYLDVCVNVVNNQVASWIHTIDFTARPGPFAALVFGGASPSWNPGLGWKGEDAVIINPDILDSIKTVWVTPTTITGLQVAHQSDRDWGANHGARQVTFNDTGYAVVAPVLALNTAAGTFTDVWVGVQSGVTSLSIYNDSANVAPGGTSIITKLVIQGQGFDPYA